MSKHKIQTACKKASKSDYQEIEEKLLKIQSSLKEAQKIAHLGNWDWDIRSDQLWWSDEIYRIFGLHPQEFNATYEAFLDRVHPDDRNMVKTSVQKAIHEKKDYDIDHRIVLPDGKVRIVHEQANIYFANGQKPVRMVGTVQDVTELREMDKAKSDFIELISHQLRMPLTTLNWYTESLLDQDDSQLSVKQKKYLQSIHASNRQMRDLINSLIEASQVESGQYPIKIEKLSLAELVENVLQRYASEIEGKKLKITKNYSIPPAINSDKGLLEVVITSLVENAIGYTSESGQIEIALTHDDSGEKVSISDTGCGIPESQQKNVFKKFFRTENAMRLDPKGKGMSLAVSKSILDKFGGKIRFQPNKNKGSVFSVWLPFTITKQ